MSKQTDDLIDRVQGAATALRSLRSKLSPTTDSPPPAPEVAQEEWDHAKKLIADLKGAVESLEAEVSRESKVPEDHSGKAKSPKSTI